MEKTEKETEKCHVRVEIPKDSNPSSSSRVRRGNTILSTLMKWITLVLFATFLALAMIWMVGFVVNWYSSDQNSAVQSLNKLDNIEQLLSQSLNERSIKSAKFLAVPGIEPSNQQRLYHNQPHTPWLAEKVHVVPRAMRPETVTKHQVQVSTVFRTLNNRETITESLTLVSTILNTVPITTYLTRNNHISPQSVAMIGQRNTAQLPPWLSPLVQDAPAPQMQPSYVRFFNRNTNPPASPLNPMALLSQMNGVLPGFQLPEVIDQVEKLLNSERNLDTEGPVLIRIKMRQILPTDDDIDQLPSVLDNSFGKLASALSPLSELPSIRGQMSSVVRPLIVGIKSRNRGMPLRELFRELSESDEMDNAHDEAKNQGIDADQEMEKDVDKLGAALDELIANLKSFSVHLPLLMFDPEIQSLKISVMALKDKYITEFISLIKKVRKESPDFGISFSNVQDFKFDELTPELRQQIEVFCEKVFDEVLVISEVLDKKMIAEYPEDWALLKEKMEKVMDEMETVGLDFNQILSSGGDEQSADFGLLFGKFVPALLSMKSSSLGALTASKNNGQPSFNAISNLMGLIKPKSSLRSITASGSSEIDNATPADMAKIISDDMKNAKTVLGGDAMSLLDSLSLVLNNRKVESDTRRLSSDMMGLMDDFFQEKPNEKQIRRDEKIISHDLEKTVRDALDVSKESGVNFDGVLSSLLGDIKLESDKVADDFVRTGEILAKQKLSEDSVKEINLLEDDILQNGEKLLTNVKELASEIESENKDQIDEAKVKLSNDFNDIKRVISSAMQSGSVNLKNVQQVMGKDVGEMQSELNNLLESVLESAKKLPSNKGINGAETLVGNILTDFNKIAKPLGKILVDSKPEIQNAEAIGLSDIINLFNGVMKQPAEKAASVQADPKQLEKEASRIAFDADKFSQALSQVTDSLEDSPEEKNVEGDLEHLVDIFNKVTGEAQKEITSALHENNTDMSKFAERIAESVSAVKSDVDQTIGDIGEKIQHLVQSAPIEQLKKKSVQLIDDVAETLDGDQFSFAEPVRRKDLGEGDNLFESSEPLDTAF